MLPESGRVISITLSVSDLTEKFRNIAKNISFCYSRRNEKGHTSSIFPGGKGNMRLRE